MKYFNFLISFLNTWLKAIGINSQKTKITIYNIPRFLYEIRNYNRKLVQSSQQAKRFPIKITQIKPCLADYNAQAGTYGSYFHQDLWAAKKIYKKQPSKHVDIGSRIDGFISHLLVFTKVIEIDIRYLESKVEGLEFLQSNATDLEIFEDNSVDSISSLHVAEHFGLGRYGDNLDPDACFIFMKNLQRVLSRNGTLLFAVPIGQDSLYFNANRKFHPQTILSNFDKLKLVSSAAVSKKDTLIENLSIKEMATNKYRLGLFEFTKL